MMGGLLDITVDDGYILYVSHKQDVIAKSIEPNWRGTQKLTINNTSFRTLPYSIKFTNVFNEFNPASEFVYKVRRNGIVVKEETVVPTKDDYIVKSLLIPAYTTYEYEIEYHFIDTGKNQDNQMGKKFNAKIEVEAN